MEGFSSLIDVRTMIKLLTNDIIHLKVTYLFTQFFPYYDLWGMRISISFYIGVSHLIRTRKKTGFKNDRELTSFLYSVLFPGCILNEI